MKNENEPLSSRTPDTCLISLFSAHCIGLWEYDCLTAKLSFINAYFRLLGLAQSGISFSDIEGLKSFIHPADLLVFNNAFAQALSAPSTLVFKYRCVSPSGEIIWLEEHLSTSPSEGSAKPEKILSYTRNITKEQAEEERNRKEREKYHTLLNAMTPNFVFIFNQDFTFHEIILPEGLRLFDDPEELLGQSARIIYSPEVSALFIENINKSLQTGELRNIEYHVELRGSHFYYQAHIVPYGGDKVFALIQDISDRVRRVNDLIAAREQAEEADRMKSAFLANMSHEIRTPLNAIVGFSEIIAENEASSDAEKEEFLGIIRTNNELLLKLVNDILDLSRIESGKSEIVFQSVHVATLLDEVKQVHALKMSPQIRFDVICPSVDLWLKTDPSRVKQILYNFLSNAIKNTPEGTITLGVEDAGGEIRFFVRDTGCGIPSDKLDKIFDRFEKVNSFGQGTGLGLPISGTLSKRLGGSIEVESTLGQGSTFSFYLPRTELEELSIDHFSEELEAKKQVRQRPVILVAENTEEGFSYAQHILLEHYDVVQATTGQEAVSLFLRERPDLVLMSIQLPVIDGLESARRIRELSSHVPIIGLTSSDFYMEQKMAMENGYNDVISRPYSATKLKEVIIALI